MSTENLNNDKYIHRKVNKTHGFTIPENYFKTIESDFLKRLTVEEFPKESGFTTPKNYFKEVENTILPKITSKEKNGKVISIRTKTYRFTSIAVAASILLFIGINYFSIKNKRFDFDDITINEAEEWLNFTYQNTDTNDDFLVAFEVSDFEENELDDSSINNNDLENYLNTLERTSIINEIN